MKEDSHDRHDVGDWVWTIQGIGWTSCWTTVHHGREFPMHVWEMNPPIIDSDVYRYWEGYDPEQRPPPDSWAALGRQNPGPHSRH